MTTPIKRSQRCTHRLSSGCGHIDCVLGPDPGPQPSPADRHYATLLDGSRFKTDRELQRNLDAGFDRHQRDLRRRYRRTRDWQDYHVLDFAMVDVGLVWTERQLVVALYSVLAALVSLIAGLVVVESMVVVGVLLLTAGAAAAVALAPYIARDGWRRARIWMLEESR